MSLDLDKIEKRIDNFIKSENSQELIDWFEKVRSKTKKIDMSELRDKAFIAHSITEGKEDIEVVSLSDAEEEIKRIKLSESGLFNDYHKIKGSLEGSYERVKKLGEENTELQKQNKELRQYTKHNEGCIWLRNGNAGCSCGLNDSLNT